MKKIIVITNKYPNEFEPNILVFLQQLCWEFADSGYEVNVISPSAINLNLNYLKLSYKSEELTENKNKINIYRPKYIGFGQKKIFGLFSFAKISTLLFKKAVIRAISKMEVEDSVLYSHFITPAGIATSDLGKKYKIKTFMAYGEATIGTLKNYGIKPAMKKLNNLSGIISVSTQNKRRLLENGFKNEDIIKVFPNGFRQERFYTRDKIESRKKFNLPKDKFIVSFVGSFDDRKGIKRLEKAVDELENIYFIAAGSGKLNPKSDKCLFSGPVKHKDLPYFYSASDVFVLPTLKEGSCNAIIEAKAMGLPIISSDMFFNYDILNKDDSILINPHNIDEIKEAINCLYQNKNKREKLSKMSLLNSKKLTIDKRAKEIIDFLIYD